MTFFWHASFNVLLNPLCKLLWVQLFDLSNKNKDKNLRNTFILLSKLYPLIIKRQFSAILLHWFHRFIIWDAEKQWKLAPNFPTTDIFGIATIKIFFNFMKTTKFVVIDQKLKLFYRQFPLILKLTWSLISLLVQSIISKNREHRVKQQQQSTTEANLWRFFSQPDPDKGGSCSAWKWFLPPLPQWRMFLTRNIRYIKRLSISQKELTLNVEWSVDWQWRVIRELSSWIHRTSNSDVISLHPLKIFTNSTESPSFLRQKLNTERGFFQEDRPY